MQGLQLAVLVLALLWRPAVPAPLNEDAKVQKLTFGSGGLNRTYYLFIPETASASGSAPMLLLLHGSGRDGKSQMDQWVSLAKTEGIVLVAPDASDSRAWRVPQEGPDFFHDLVELVRVSNDVVDERRVYVFGHSAGAIHALDLGLLESQYFAAIAAHAGIVSPEVAPFIQQAPRKIPMAIWVGTADPLFPVMTVRRTQASLNDAGFNAQLTEIKGHTHDYYSRAADINKQVWAFLKDKKLADAPHFQQYQLIK